MHEATNVGSDRSQLAHVAKETKATLQTDTLEAVADRGYFSGEEILACDQAESRCTTGVQCRITRWEHEDVLEAVQKKLDENPQAMRRRRETVEHPFGTIKARMGAIHFLMKTLPRVAAEMALHVLVYNLTRVMNIMGSRRLIAAMHT
jgi:hypothetical protein